MHGLPFGIRQIEGNALGALRAFGRFRTGPLWSFLYRLFTCVISFAIATCKVPVEQRTSECVPQLLS